MSQAPKKGDSFYIHDIDGDKGICFVTFFQSVKIYQHEGGKEFDCTECTLPAVWHEGLEEDIRHNFQVWSSHAMAFEIERQEIHDAIDDFLYGLSLQSASGGDGP